MNLATYRLLSLLVGSLCLFSAIAPAQGHCGDVMVAVMKGRVVALPAGGSGVEESLGMSESVITTETRGQTAFARPQTDYWDFLLNSVGGRECD